MARKYSERIESMDADSREEFDARIQEYHKAHGWQKTLAKFKPSPIQLRAILAGKDATKAKAKTKKKKPKAEAAASAPTATKKKAKKAAKKKAKAAKKKAGRPKAVASAAPKAAKKKPGRPKGSGKKKASRKNGVANGDLIIEGRIDAGEFVSMVLLHSERMAKLALSA